MQQNDYLPLVIHAPPYIQVPNYSYKETQKMIKHITNDPKVKPDNMFVLTNINKTNYRLTRTLTEVLTRNLEGDAFLSVDLLLEHGANPNLVVDDVGSTPIHCFIRKIRTANVDIVVNILELLLDNGADIYRSDKFGLTPLDMMVSGYKLKVFDEDKPHINPIFKSVINELITRRQNNSKFILQFFMSLDEDKLKLINSWLYTSVLNKIKPVLDKYRQSILSALERKKYNNTSIFHPQQLGETITQYILLK